VQYRRARKRGDVPRGQGIGSLIEIHGHGGKETNWTSGCIAIRNEHLDEVYAKVKVGTPVTIVGAARLPGDDLRGADTE
jgi:L,D-peptidoglycan transpeptidase YkuD (ErfK/YbiS/YcfS/YnhG family)